MEPLLFFFFSLLQNVPSRLPCVDIRVCVCVCRPHVDLRKLSRNTKVVAEALARVIYNLTEKVNAEVLLWSTALTSLQHG